MAQPSSLLDDELSPAERQRFNQALNDAVFPITLEALRASNTSAGHNDVLAARTLALAHTGRQTLTQMGHGPLVDEWLVYRYQQDMALSLITRNGMDASRTLATWTRIFSEPSDVLAAAASVPFTSPRGRELSLVDLLASHPDGHDAAKTLLNQRARGVSARALTSAIHHRREDLLDLLLNAGAPANGPEHPQNLNDLPLAIGTAVRAGDDPAEVRAFNERCWDALVAWGADVNRQVRGHSLLVMAIGQRDAARVRWLIDHGANVNETWTIPQIGRAPVPRAIVDLLDRWHDETAGQDRSEDLQTVLAVRDTLHQARDDQQAMQGILAPSATDMPRARR